MKPSRNSLTDRYYASLLCIIIYLYVLKKDKLTFLRHTIWPPCLTQSTHEELKMTIESCSPKCLPSFVIEIVYPRAMYAPLCAVTFQTLPSVVLFSKGHITSANDNHVAWLILDDEYITVEFSVTYKDKQIVQNMI